ncbi:hypothetical protein DSL72_003251 [Monilinia vaccinii-corymbosi]|uniref:Uncharacterized protein n=1 Tax=Monilinia vaccinii-corymbosi TaxID=61207 RepID=A0A8A3P7Q3_9HELO|nr:hypothetical protein DSL72_003251 [Monilinia vaccinii-corymbosi]
MHNHSHQTPLLKLLRQRLHKPTLRKLTHTIRRIRNRAIDQIRRQRPNLNEALRPALTLQQQRDERTRTVIRPHHVDIEIPAEAGRVPVGHLLGHGTRVPAVRHADVEAAEGLADEEAEVADLARGRDVAGEDLDAGLRGAEGADFVGDELEVGGRSGGEDEPAGSGSRVAVGDVFADAVAGSDDAGGEGGGEGVVAWRCGGREGLVAGGGYGVHYCLF